MSLSFKNIALTLCLAGTQTAIAQTKYNNQPFQEIDTATVYMEKERNTFRDNVIALIGRDEFMDLQRAEIKQFRIMENDDVRRDGSLVTTTTVYATRNTISPNFLGTPEMRVMHFTFKKQERRSPNTAITKKEIDTTRQYSIEYETPYQNTPYFLFKRYMGIEKNGVFTLSLQELLVNDRSVAVDDFDQVDYPPLKALDKEGFRNVFLKTARNIYGEFFLVPLGVAYGQGALPIGPYRHKKSDFTPLIAP